jgi:Na+/melibiose symporter-like transporter
MELITLVTILCFIFLVTSAFYYLRCRKYKATIKTLKSELERKDRWARMVG